MDHEQAEKEIPFKTTLKNRIKPNGGSEDLHRQSCTAQARETEEKARSWKTLHIKGLILLKCLQYQKQST